MAYSADCGRVTGMEHHQCIDTYFARATDTSQCHRSEPEKLPGKETLTVIQCPQPNSAYEPLSSTGSRFRTVKVGASERLPVTARPIRDGWNSPESDSKPNAWASFRDRVTRISPAVGWLPVPVRRGVVG